MSLHARASTKRGEHFSLSASAEFVVGMARCAVPVAERRVRRWKREADTHVLARVPPGASLQVGTTLALPFKNQLPLPPFRYLFFKIITIIVVVRNLRRVVK
jgi:hypothetical protein